MRTRAQYDRAESFTAQLISLFGLGPLSRCIFCVAYVETKDCYVDDWGQIHQDRHQRCAQQFGGL